MYYNLPSDIRDHITWCEGHFSPQDFCGDCVPCKRMKHLGLWNRDDTNTVTCNEESPCLPKIKPKRKKR